MMRRGKASNTRFLSRYRHFCIRFAIGKKFGEEPEVKQTKKSPHPDGRELFLLFFRLKQVDAWDRRQFSCLSTNTDQDFGLHFDATLCLAAIIRPFVS